MGQSENTTFFYTLVCWLSFFKKSNTSFFRVAQSRHKSKSYVVRKYLHWPQRGGNNPKYSLFRLITSGIVFRPRLEEHNPEVKQRKVGGNSFEKQSGSVQRCACISAQMKTHIVSHEIVRRKRKQGPLLNDSSSLEIKLCIQLVCVHYK